MLVSCPIKLEQPYTCNKYFSHNTPLLPFALKKQLKKFIESSIAVTLMKYNMALYSDIAYVQYNIAVFRAK